MNTSKDTIVLQIFPPDRTKYFINLGYIYNLIKFTYMMRLSKTTKLKRHKFNPSFTSHVREKSRSVLPGWWVSIDL